MEESDFMWLTMLLGGVLAFLGLYLASKKLTSQRSNSTDTSEEKNEENKSSEAQEVTVPTGSKKRAVKSKKRREAQQEFSHPWMVGTLKGHTAQILDVDVSANGKFVATCAEECDKDRPAKVNNSAGNDHHHHQRQKTTPPSPTSSTSSSRSNVSSDDNKERQRVVLSRRQRKNRSKHELREREDEAENESKPVQRSVRQAKRKPSKNLKNQTNLDIRANNAKKTASKSSKMQSIVHYVPQTVVDYEPLTSVATYPEHKTDHFSDAEVAHYLRRYVISTDKLIHYGYPMELQDYPGYVAIMCYPHQQKNHQKKQLDVHAREFVPGSYSNTAEPDSGNGTAGSSSLEASDQEADEPNASPRSQSESQPLQLVNVWFSRMQNKQSQTQKQQQQTQITHKKEAVIERKCTRCKLPFLVRRENGAQVTAEPCYYHWGKFDNSKSSRECCKLTRGCLKTPYHVWTGVVSGFNGPYADFVRTQPSPIISVDGYYGVYALDCEMCYTTKGLEVGKVSVVDLNCDTVYETYCKPDAPVIDYNTRFSGLRPSDLQHATKTLRDVQRDLLSFIHAETILIGHGLENDLRALKLLHLNVIDTCWTFPHPSGYPYRYSLKNLAQEHLNENIQCYEHDSAEDAQVVMRLVLTKLENDLSHNCVQPTSYLPYY